MYEFKWVFIIFAESQKPPRLPPIGAWQGGTCTYPKWPRMQNICKTRMKHTHLRWWNVCDAYVKRMCSVSENICEPYVKHMWNIWNTYDTLKHFATRLRCVYGLLMYTFGNLCCCFFVGGKIRPYFVQITQNKTLFWNACKKKHK